MSLRQYRNDIDLDWDFSSSYAVLSTYIQSASFSPLYKSDVRVPGFTDIVILETNSVDLQFFGQPSRHPPKVLSQPGPRQNGSVFNDSLRSSQNIDFWPIRKFHDNTSTNDFIEEENFELLGSGSNPLSPEISEGRNSWYFGIPV
jgi:hypothetical protein